MIDLFDLQYLLGRGQIEQRLREAEAARLLPPHADGALPLRQRLGWTLVRVGMLLVGPRHAQPLRGH